MPAPHPTPTLVVLDIGLDGPEDGLALGRWLRQQPGLLLCYVTGRAEPELFARARLLAPLAYVCKSPALAELHHQLVLALDQARRLAAPTAAPPTHLALPTGTARVAVADIQYVAVVDHRCTLHTATAGYGCTKSLGQVLALLHGSGFRRVRHALC